MSRDACDNLLVYYKKEVENHFTANTENREYNTNEKDFTYRNT